jgi:hypothetical protein
MPPDFAPQFSARGPVMVWQGVIRSGQEQIRCELGYRAAAGRTGHDHARLAIWHAMQLAASERTDLLSPIRKDRHARRRRTASGNGGKDG